MLSAKQSKHLFEIDFNMLREISMTPLQIAVKQYFTINNVIFMRIKKLSFPPHRFMLQHFVIDRTTFIVRTFKITNAH